MSETIAVTEEVTTVPAKPLAKAKRTTKPKDGVVKKAPAKRIVNVDPDFSEFRAWLVGLGLHITPVLHVNGKAFENAVVTIDFGQPLKPVKLDNDQTSELVGRIRKIVRDIVAKEVNVRVSIDAATGIWWASIS